MRPGSLALFASLVVTLTACSGAGGSGSGSGSSASSPAASAGSAAPLSTRVDVRLSDALTIEPAIVAVPAGRPVTFVVTNAGAMAHEFYVGDEAAQRGHAGEMTGMAGMTHDEAMGIGLEPGQTKQLTVTFDHAGTLLAGCHVAGHYDAGMKATIQVTG